VKLKNDSGKIPACFNCICPYPECRNPLRTKKGIRQFCKEHSCSCVDGKGVLKDDEYFLMVKYSKYHYVPEFLRPFDPNDWSMISKNHSCLEGFTKNNVYRCEIKSEKCVGKILSSGAEYLKIGITSLDPHKRRILEKNYSLKDILDVTETINCDNCKLAVCPVYQCDFKISHNSVSTYCIMHTKAPTVCLRKHCYNLLDELDKSAHECTDKELFRICNKCNSEYNNPIVHMPDKFYEYEIFPNRYKSILRKSRNDHKKKCILIELFITRKRNGKVWPVINKSSLSTVRSYHLLFSNMILFGDHKMSVMTTNLQFEAINKDRSLNLTPTNVDKCEVALLMLLLLPMNLVIFILNHVEFDKY
jgi:hypothetical protein